MGVHQKIDRVARKYLQPLLPDGSSFPATNQILHFEGKNGPDGIKRKSPAIDEPWHFINPHDPNDSSLLDAIDAHMQNLTRALVQQNHQRAAFEAAWMSHAVVDGLTPAHHFPMEETLRELRSGRGLETRTTILQKNLMIGENAVATLRNNWKFWGPKGAMTMHGGFELGIASAIAYRRFADGNPQQNEIQQARESGYRAYYISRVQEVSSLQLYEKFAQEGWTTSLARQANQQLLPLIIRSVTIGWLMAAENLERSSHQ